MVKLFSLALFFTIGLTAGFFGFGQWFLSRHANNVHFLAEQLSQCRTESRSFVLQTSRALGEIADETANVAQAVSMFRQARCYKFHEGDFGTWCGTPDKFTKALARGEFDEKARKTIWNVLAKLELAGNQGTVGQGF